MANNLFSYKVKNEFIDSKETEIHVNYCGRQIGVAFFYLGSVYIDFTEQQPMISMNHWHFLETLLKQIQRQYHPVS